ncbi:hypothetical protein ASE24_06940 [Nocardioides sp. Root224]|nr:hypothetical protein ASE24_06940 [Nocardioides sp. Root224]
MVLVLLGLLLGATVCGLESVRLSALSAQERAVRADQGGAAFTVQAGGPQARKALAGVPSLIRVSDASGSVSLEAATTPTAVRVVNEPGVALGRIIDGRAAGAGEATVSLAVAQALDADLGDQVEIASEEGATRRAELVGITVNEVDGDDATAVVVDVDLGVAQTDIWLSESDPYLEPSLTKLMDARTMTYRPTASLVEQARTNLPPGLSSLSYAPIGMALLLGVLLIGTLAAMAPVARGDVSTLVQASMSPRSAWGLIVRVAVATLVVGIATGFALVSTTLWVARYRVSEIIGHRWEGIELAWLALLGLGVTVLAAAAATMLVLGRAAASDARTVRSPQVRAGGWRSAAVVAGCGVLVLVVVTVQKATSASSSIAGYVPLAVLMVTGATPWLVGALVARRLPPASRAVVRQFTAHLLVATALAGIIAAGTAGSGSRTVHNANVAEHLSRAPQPPGSFLIYEVPDRAATLLVERYRSLGGHDVDQFQLPDEAHRRLRVTSTRLIDCMSEAQTLNPDTVPDGCFSQETMAPVNSVVLALDGEGGPRSDPGLVDQGAVGLLEYVALTPEAASTGHTEAQPDSSLGGNMPGLVVAPDSEIARRYDLRSGGRRLVALLDFQSLSRRDQALVRGLVSRVAPGAQTADAADASSFDRERARATATEVLGAALVLLALVAGGSALVAGQRRTLRTLVEIGAVERHRLRLLVLTVCVPVLTMALALPLAAWGTWLSGFAEPGAWGALWTLPVVAGLIGSAVVGLLLVRVPSRIGE